MPTEPTPEQKRRSLLALCFGVIAQSKIRLTVDECGALGIAAYSASKQEHYWNVEVQGRKTESWAHRDVAAKAVAALVEWMMPEKVE